MTDAYHLFSHRHSWFTKMHTLLIPEISVINIVQCFHHIVWFSNCMHCLQYWLCNSYYLVLSFVTK